jgi:V/A-type H+-transporting ATPase subunit I
LFVAVASYTSDPHIPDEAERLPLPSRDAPSIRAEAREIDEALYEDTRRLHVLATLVPAMRDELRALQQQVNETVALRGAADDPTIFAVQGWLPAENVGVLDERLSGRDIPIVIESMKPDEDEQPPTLVRPPAWARSIEGLFGVLGTVPGYREFDVSIPFLIALPIFTAMLISDGGYGALLLLGPALAYPWVSKQLGARFTQLLMIVGAVSLVWGILSNAFFGFKVLPFTLIPVDQTDASRQLMMNLSFTLGAIHLSIAQLWQAIRYFPNLQALSKLGWAIFVWGMYGVVRMFVLQDPLNWSTPWPYLLMAGATLAILFASPSRNLLKMLGLGLAQFPLSLLSAFSDVISYVRLMAVGVASSVLAVSFNDMAFEAGILPLTIVILIFGHGLNVGLAMIAMFAHGVRLNMLEFGNNLGMEWVGYAYKPFARITE